MSLKYKYNNNFKISLKRLNGGFLARSTNTTHILNDCHLPLPASQTSTEFDSFRPETNNSHR